MGAPLHHSSISQPWHHVSLVCALPPNWVPFGKRRSKHQCFCSWLHARGTCAALAVSDVALQAAGSRAKDTGCIALHRQALSETRCLGAWAQLRGAGLAEEVKYHRISQLIPQKSSLSSDRACSPLHRCVDFRSKRPLLRWRDLLSAVKT